MKVELLLYASVGSAAPVKARTPRRTTSARKIALYLSIINFFSFAESGAVATERAAYHPKTEQCIVEIRKKQLSRLRAEASDASSPFSGQSAALLSHIYSYGNFSRVDEELKDDLREINSCIPNKDDWYLTTENSLASTSLARQLMDKDEAIKFARIGVDRKNSDAMVLLGDAFYAGDRLPKNIVAAMGMYAKAAALGNHRAQQSLGYMYAGEADTPKIDLLRAYMWFNIAATAKNQEVSKRAIENRRRTSSKMSRKEIAEAESMSTRCVDSKYTRCDSGGAGWLDNFFR